MYKRWKEITENYKYLSAVDKETIDNLMEQLDDSISLLAIKNHFHGNENNVIKFARLNSLDPIRKENSNGIVIIDTRLNGVIKHIKKALKRDTEELKKANYKYNVRKLLEAME
ncbi:TPA: hypothetical protein ACGH17_004554 [Salmonella enterica subsp. enterica serovar Anatum]|nr:hypothetical protein [Salmonella enterica]EBJ9131247.1 hypothetical protein [Salmonella enterica]